MPTIRVEAQVTGPELLKAVEQLGPSEFQQFVSEVLTLRAHRHAPPLSPSETDLLERINQGLPTDMRQHYEQLIGKRQNLTLTPEEHVELLRLSNEVERLEADRLAALAQLAQLRKTSLGSLMKELGIQAPAHG